MHRENKEIFIDGQRVLYCEKNSKRKKIIVLLHGYPGNYEGLMDLANNLGKKYRIIMPNFPSCGGSDPLKTENNLKNFAEWLKIFLETISVNKAIIIGHSFGSRVAMVFSATYPEMVEQMVLITPVLKPDSKFLYILSPYYKMAKLLPPMVRKKFLSNKPYEYVACKIVLKSKNNDLHKKIINRGIKELQYVYPTARIDLFEEFCKSDLIKMGDKIEAKTLIIAGGKDELVTKKSIEDFVNQVKNVSLETIENSGHLLPFESPESTAEIILSWI